MKALIKTAILIILLMSFSLLFTSCTPKLATEIYPSGAGLVNPSSGTYENGVSVSVTATPNAGFRFDHWEGGASGNSPSIHVTINGSTKLIAHFIRIYTLSVTVSPSSSGQVTPNTKSYDAGQTVTLNAEPLQYFNFDGWSGDASGNSNQVTFVMNKDMHLTASFSKIKYTLQTNVGTPGGGTIEPSSGNFEAGTTVAVRALPAQGYRFNKWQGSESSTNSVLSLLMNTNKTLTASFTKVFNLAVSVSPNNAGNVGINPSASQYDEGSKVTLSATASFPYAFSKWSGTDNDSSNPTNITMNSDKSIVVNFVELKPGTTQSKSGMIYNDGTPMPVVPLTAGQWVEVGIHVTPNSHVTIEDPYFSQIQDLGLVSSTSYRFQANNTGNYVIRIRPNSLTGTGYEVKYTVYSQP